MKQESDLLITIMIANRIGLHSVLLPINYNHHNFCEKIQLEQISPMETMHKVKNSSISDAQFFFG